MHKMLQYRRRCIMYINTGYLNHSHKDFKDKSRPLIVGSCGTYRLSQHPKMPTYRPRGRLDYQIIYISSGLVHFHFDNPENETIIPAGHIVLFRPKELQKYEFAKVQLINVNSKMRKNLFYFLTKKGRTFPLVKISFFERY